MLSADLFIIINHRDVWRKIKKWMYPGKKVSNYYSYKDGNIAASYGYLELIKERHEYLKFGIDAMDYAARNGHLDVIKWLHINRSEGCTKYAMAMAAEHGHLDVLKWLHLNRSEGCTKNAMDR